jgi:inhibitor of KinA sporulation pathway (predicted exonuclease)
MTSYIIYDLEMTMQSKRVNIMDTIEIGAVKLQLQQKASHPQDPNTQLVLVDLFQAYVRPTRVKDWSAQTTQFTGIPREKIDEALPFYEVIADFRAWVGSSRDDYYLISWGPEDKQQLVVECTHHQLPTSWIRNHNDLQRMWADVHQLAQHQQIGLARALEALQLPFKGKPHNALDDAYNTADIFIRLFPRLQLERNEISDIVLNTGKTVYCTERYVNNPFAALLKDRGVSG